MVRQQTCDLYLPPMLNNATTIYNDDKYDKRGGGLILDWNDDDSGGVGSEVDDEPNEDNDRIQRVIYHGMGGTYNFFLSLYSR